jgi:hypothetical protein
VIIIAVNRSADELRVFSSKHDDSVVKFVCFDAKLGKLIAHRLDAVALLDSLVGDTVDPRALGTEILDLPAGKGRKSRDGGKD